MHKNMQILKQEYPRIALYLGAIRGLFYSHSKHNRYLCSVLQRIHQTVIAHDGYAVDHSMPQFFVKFDGQSFKLHQLKEHTADGDGLGIDGKDGADGKDGVDGKDGITPQIRINAETNEWEVSYDNGSTWTSLGVKAIGSDGRDGSDGEKGDKGDKGEPGEKGDKGSKGAFFFFAMSAFPDMRRGKIRSQKRKGEKTWLHLIRLSVTRT